MSVAKKVTVPKTLTRKQRLEDLQAFVQICFASLPEDLKEVSNLTGLHITTLYRLRRGEVTLKTHYNTVTTLGYAARLRLDWVRSRARIVLLD